MAEPKVCVTVSTYNHANYIREALDGALMQRPDFPFRILVHDDASEDGTREIVEAYAKAHPDVIRTILQDENQFRKGRRIYSILWPHFEGRYIAMLDGDDAWTDPDKLAVQAAFLDAHPRCAICQTGTAYVDDATGERIRAFPPPARRRKRLDLDHLAYRNFIQTSAAMFRRDALPALPEDFDEIPFGDYAIFALLARKGWIGFIDAEMTRYRIHGTNWFYGKPADYVSERERKVREFIIRHLPEKERAVWREVRDGVAPGFWTRKIRRARRGLRSAMTW